MIIKTSENKRQQRKKKPQKYPERNDVRKCQFDQQSFSSNHGVWESTAFFKY